MTDLELVHRDYIHDHRYRRKLHAQLRRRIAEEPRELSRMTVVHETDGRCCKAEPWPTSYAKLLQALTADGERVAGVVL